MATLKIDFSISISQQSIENVMLVYYKYHTDGQTHDARTMYVNVNAIAYIYYDVDAT